MKNLKIAVIGSTQITKNAILIMKKNNIKIDLIVTKKKDSINTDYVNLKKEFKNYKVIYDKELKKKSTILYLKKLKFDLILCMGWSHIIQTKILKLTKYGAIGHHPTLLPSNRGKHPLIWSKFLGLENFGSSFFFLTNVVDQGKIILKDKIKIEKSDDSQQILKKLYKVLDYQIPKLFKNFSNLIKKSKRVRGADNYWRKRYFFDGKIDFRMTAEAIDRLVKALAPPYACSHVEKNDKIFKIKKSKVVKNKIKNLVPGKILKIKKNSLIVKCYEDSIELFDKKLCNYCNKSKYLF